jgi:hypothetical protein
LQMFSNIFANWSKMPSINYKQMCFYPTFVCGCRLTLSLVPTYTRTHTHALSLSLRLFALSPLLSVWYKNPFPRLFGHHWNTRFRCIRLFSFHR